MKKIISTALMAVSITITAQAENNPDLSWGNTFEKNKRVITYTQLKNAPEIMDYTLMDHKCQKSTKIFTIIWNQKIANNSELILEFEKLGHNPEITTYYNGRMTQFYYAEVPKYFLFFDSMEACKVFEQPTKQ